MKKSELKTIIKEVLKANNFRKTANNIFKQLGISRKKAVPGTYNPSYPIGTIGRGPEFTKGYIWNNDYRVEFNGLTEDEVNNISEMLSDEGFNNVVHKNNNQYALYQYAIVNKEN